MKHANLLKIFISILIGGLFLISCAPKTESPTFKGTKSHFKPRLEDTELNLESIESDNFLSTIFNPPTGETMSGEMFQYAENLIVLGLNTKKSELISAGNNYINTFYANPKTTDKIEFSNSPYIQAALATSKSSAVKALDNYFVVLKNDLFLINNFLNKTKEQYKFPDNITSLSESVSEIEKYLHFISENISDAKTSEAVTNAFKLEINNQITQLLPQLSDLTKKIETSNSSSEVFQILDSLIKLINFELSPKDKELLKDGKEIVNAVDKMDSAQDALSVIIKIWKKLSPEEREKHFSSANKKLYKYLKSRNSLQLDCLESYDCVLPATWLAKNLKIYPKLKDYGIRKLSNDLSQKILPYLKSRITQTFAQSIKTLPTIVSGKAGSTINNLCKNLKSLSLNFDSEVHRLAYDWANKNLPDSHTMINGMEITKISINRSNSNNIIIDAASDTKNNYSSAESIGSSMSALSYLWSAKNNNLQKNNTEIIKSIIEQINKLLIIYNSHAGVINSVRSIAKPKYLNRFQSVGVVPLGIPDLINQTQDDENDKSFANYSFSAKSQSELLNGITKLMNFFRDWEFNLYDETLGKITLADLDLNFPKGSLTQKIFPKESMYALSIGSSQGMLESLTKSYSPLFLITENNNIIWADQFNFNTDSAVAAGIVDLQGGERSLISKTSDTSRFIISLIEFLKATDDIERTKSSSLLKPDSEGARALDKIISGRKKLRLLVIALSNFLASKVASVSGGVAESYSITDQMPLSISKSLETQSLSVRALLAASEYLEMDIYKATAIDIYYFMNKELFNSEFGFYNTSASNKSMPSPLQITLTLRMLTEVIPYLEKEGNNIGAIQAQKILNYWTEKIILKEKI